MIYLGGTRLTGAKWVGTHALSVRFESSHIGLIHQLYAGRTLIGVAASTTARVIVGQLVQTDWPQRLHVIAVSGELRNVDHGHLLPVRPYNRASITIDSTAITPDARRVVVTAGTTPGGAVDPANRVASSVLEGDGEYVLLTDVLPGSGEWNLAVTAYDRAEPDGNAGTPLTLSLRVESHPPDFMLNDDGRRLRDFAIADQTLTVSVVLP